MKSRVKLLTLLCVLTLAVSSCWMPQKQHVIMFISDGTQLEHYIATSRYLFGKDKGLVFQKGMDYEGYVTTWDVSAYNKEAATMSRPTYDPANIDWTTGYDPERGGWAPFPICIIDSQDAYFDRPYAVINCTDSASSATAIFTGNKTLTKTIGYDYTKTVKLTTIAEILRAERGFAIGSCSTVPFTHATPAAVIAHNTVRDDYWNLADEIINVFKPEVCIAGGWPNPDIVAEVTNKGAFNYISEDEYNALKASADYKFVERTAGINGGYALKQASREAARKDQRLFGLYGGAVKDFASSHHIEARIPSDTPGYPSFEYVTEENPTLADIVESAIPVLQKDPDGFFVMFEGGDIDWANHYGDYKWMIGAAAEFNLAVATAIAMVNKPGDDMDWSNTTLIITSDHANSMMRLTDSPKLGKGDLPEQILNEETGKYEYPGGELTYMSTCEYTYHTNEPVMLWAKGKDAKAFKKLEGKYYPGTKLIDNTQLIDAIKDICDIE